MQRYIFADKRLNNCVIGILNHSKAVFKKLDVYPMRTGGVYEIRYVSEMRQAPLQR